ncbi:MAG: ABC transporter ATP-binding protein [Chloroflexi bacterium]|nr:ABC transporter ATP-binding protein [Chloroflexota bacterium]
MKELLRIVGLAFAHKWQLVAAYACLAGASAAYLLLPRFIGRAVDDIAQIVSSGEVPQGAILGTVLIVLALSTLRGVLSFGQNYLAESLAQTVGYKLRNSFFDHVQHLSFGFHDRQHTGNLMSRAIRDVDNIRMFVNQGVVRTPYFAALLVGVAIILLRLDWRLGLIGMSFVPPAILQSTFLRFKVARIWMRAEEKSAALNTTLQENLTGVRVVKAFAAESYEEEKFATNNRGVAADMVEAERLHVLNDSLLLLAFLTSLGLIMWLGGRQVINGQMSLGELTEFILYMQILATPVAMAGNLIRAFARAVVAGRRLFEVLDAKSPVLESPGAMELPRVSGRLRFENVGFSYDERHPVLKGIDFEVEPGKVVALLGAPGSGKSTIVDLIPRFYDVRSGRISVDGIDVRDVTLESLRRNIGIVQQDNFLFTASLRDNIAYGRPDATTSEIVQAAKIAQLHEFMESLPEGYDTQVGERGSTLSGGQRQRLAIARAVLLDPPILILDDSTSSVDAGTEELIRQAMESVMRGRTTLVIAHRLNTIQRADVILVLKDGEIVQRGTHQELLIIRGPYREIYELQLRPQEEIMREVDAPAFVAQEARQ